MKQLTAAIYLCSSIFVSLYVLNIMMLYSAAYHFALWIFPILLLILFYVTVKPEQSAEKQ
ncbi:hypothetical protein [Sporosarcina gallistercoris]|uniref:Uncharacterized protein n=1 Tax=Sporosarcina gallistercoris TaxID=2762245 RepID=A0ABR8PMC6_9BACL|nr:hypothetical protein [Sporosarcina gallistercoris]MBD7909316.1 hypothetical protein [Sporosarcina gallistercoris]